MDIQIGDEQMSLEDLINAMLKRGLVITLKTADELPGTIETFIVSCSACGWIGQPVATKDAANRSIRAHRATCAEREGDAERDLKNWLTEQSESADDQES